MSRFVSQCCSCSFAYNITCPSLKVPIQPTIVGCASAECIGALPSIGCFQQCGDAIWAFGDGLAAVNGIVTGADSALDASCNFACCFTRTCPCVQYNLCCCMEVYQNPGVYAHRIRYVTDSFEVSDFSEPGLFCIKQAYYGFDCATCCLGNNQCTISVDAVTSGTTGVNNCVLFEIATDSDFSNVISTNTNTAQAISNSDYDLAVSDINPKSDGTYYDAGTTFYTRTTTFGGYTCQCQCVSDTTQAVVGGDLFVFALSDGVSDSPTDEGCCCIQLYATYTPAQDYCLKSSIDTSYKFDVSPFCTFCSDVVTCCGCYNVFIPKSSLGGAGACANYYVRACLLNTSMAPNVVTCAILGNVTYVAPTQVCASSACYCSDGSLCFYTCSGTISWTGPLVLFGIGSGGAGVACATGPLCCSGQSNSVACAFNYCASWNSMINGCGGQMILQKLENDAGILNGCSFCLYAPEAEWGSFRCIQCSSGENSFAIIGDTCYQSNAIAGLRSGGGTSGLSSCHCFPFFQYVVAAPPGASGIVKLDSDASSITSTGILFHCCCYAFGGCCQCSPISCYDTKGRMNSRILSYCCYNGPCVGPPAGCNYGVCEFTNPPACCICECCCHRNFVGLNLFGLGGPGAVWCVRTYICCYCAIGMMQAPCRGWGFGAAGAMVCGGTPGGYGECWYHYSQGACDVGSGCRFWCELHNSQFLWYGCFAHSYACNGRMMCFGGGAAGMLFMCNHPAGCGCAPLWKGRPGIMMIACQGFS